VEVGELLRLGTKVRRKKSGSLEERIVETVYCIPFKNGGALEPKEISGGGKTQPNFARRHEKKKPSSPSWRLKKPPRLWNVEAKLKKGWSQLCCGNSEPKKKPGAAPFCERARDKLFQKNL